MVRSAATPRVSGRCPASPGEHEALDQAAAVPLKQKIPWQKHERARRLSGRTQFSEMSGKPHSRIASESAATGALGARP